MREQHISAITATPSIDDKSVIKSVTEPLCAVFSTSSRVLDASFGCGITSAAINAITPDKMAVSAFFSRYFFAFIFTTLIVCIIIHNPPKLTQNVTSAHMNGKLTFSPARNATPFVISSVDKRNRNTGFNVFIPKTDESFIISADSTVKNIITPHTFTDEIKPSVTAEDRATEKGRDKCGFCAGASVAFLYVSKNIIIAAA